MHAKHKLRTIDLVADTNIRKIYQSTQCKTILPHGNIWDLVQLFYRFSIDVVMPLKFSCRWCNMLYCKNQSNIH